MSDIKEMSDEAKKAAKDTYARGKDKVESVAHQFSDCAADMYKDGKRKIHDLEDNIDEYAHELITKIKAKPFTAVLIAGGIGYLLSHLLKK